MRQLIEMMKIAKGEESEVVAIAMGKYEFTGRIFKDFLKIIKNGKGNS